MNKWTPIRRGELMKKFILLTLFLTSVFPLQYGYANKSGYRDIAQIQEVRQCLGFAMHSSNQQLYEHWKGQLIAAIFASGKGEDKVSLDREFTIHHSYADGMFFAVKTIDKSFFNSFEDKCSDKK